MIWPLILLLALPPISLSVTPRLCLAPCDLRITVTIEPNRQNRAFVVELSDGDLLVDRSEQQLDETSPRTQPFLWFIEVGKGEYAVTAVLYQDREVARTHTTVSVN